MILNLSKSYVNVLSICNDTKLTIIATVSEVYELLPIIPLSKTSSLFTSGLKNLYLQLSYSIICQVYYYYIG